MLLEDIGTLVPADIGSALFYGDYPSSPDNIITIYPSGGTDPAHSFTDREFENPSIQIRVRNKSYPAGFAQCERIKDTLDGLAERVINGNRYLSIMQQGDILPLGRDDSGRHEWSINFNVRVKRGG